MVHCPHCEGGTVLPINKVAFSCQDCFWSGAIFQCPECGGQDFSVGETHMGDSKCDCHECGHSAPLFNWGRHVARQAS